MLLLLSPPSRAVAAFAVSVIAAAVPVAHAGKAAAHGDDRQERQQQRELNAGTCPPDEPAAGSDCTDVGEGVSCSLFDLYDGGWEKKNCFVTCTWKKEWEGVCAGVQEPPNNTPIGPPIQLHSCPPDEPEAGTDCTAVGVYSCNLGDLYGGDPLCSKSCNGQVWEEAVCEIPSEIPILTPVTDDPCATVDVAPGESCPASGLQCNIGTEKCCGRSHTSMKCECAANAWMCLMTEACMMPNPNCLYGDDSECDATLSSPVVYGCNMDSLLVINYSGGEVECGAPLTVSQAADAPTVQMKTADPSALYTVLLIDTSISDAHPILHFGAVNVPGSSLGVGVDLTSTAWAPFKPYAGPNLPSPEMGGGLGLGVGTAFADLFHYEWVVAAQEGSVDIPTHVSNMRFDHEAFLANHTVGDKMTSYFSSGHCVEEVMTETTETTVTTPPADSQPQSTTSPAETTTAAPPETTTTSSAKGQPATTTSSPDSRTETTTTAPDDGDNSIGTLDEDTSAGYYHLATTPAVAFAIATSYGVFSILL